MHWPPSAERIGFSIRFQCVVHEGIKSRGVPEWKSSLYKLRDIFGRVQIRAASYPLQKKKNGLTTLKKKKTENTDG